MTPERRQLKPALLTLAFDDCNFNNMIFTILLFALLWLGKDYIVEHYKWYGGPKPPLITHHGIDDAYAEKASKVRYFYRGKWLELQGAD